MPRRQPDREPNRRAPAPPWWQEWLSWRPSNRRLGEMLQALGRDLNRLRDDLLKPTATMTVEILEKEAK